jgi:hypothetical protein
MICKSVQYRNSNGSRIIVPEEFILESSFALNLKKAVEIAKPVSGKSCFKTNAFCHIHTVDNGGRTSKTYFNRSIKPELSNLLDITWTGNFLGGVILYSGR